MRIVLKFIHFQKGILLDNPIKKNYSFQTYFLLCYVWFEESIKERKKML